MKRQALKYATLLFLAVIAHFSVMAQLNADFTIDHSVGCSPLVSKFLNQTTGASPLATYEWDFDNGNSSTLLNPSGVFIEERTYTIKLTVTDGNQKSVKTRSVTTYEKSTVDFSASVKEGCSPLEVTYSATATAPSGNIATYTWDYGDGFTTSERNSQTSHTYENAQEATVTLSVTDDYGCVSTKVIPDMVHILPGVKADFEAEKTFVCLDSDSVQLLDKSVSHEPLSYSWRFSDGSTSHDQNPKHSFNKKGEYGVTLVVKSSLGCTSELTKDTYINVGKFNSQIGVRDIVCKDSKIELINQSAPAPFDFSWSVNNNPIYQEYDGTYSYTFQEAGKYTVELRNKFGECSETVVKTVTVNESLQAGFVADLPEVCNVPVTVTFKDTTRGAIQTEWTFNQQAEIQATGKTASHIYYQGGYSYTTMFVTDKYGCKTSIDKLVEVNLPYINLRTIDGNHSRGCEKLTKKFSFESNTELSSFTWHFGDNTTSTEKEPEHTYGSGSFQVELEYTTTKGCRGRVRQGLLIEVSEKPKADFSAVSGTTVCGNEPTTFSFAKNAVSASAFFIINDEYKGTVNMQAPYTMQFQDTGLHTMSLVVYNNGCQDTVTRKDYIRVVPSFPEIVNAMNTCDGDRGKIHLQQRESYATQWKWDFGDGTTEVHNEEKLNFDHEYAKTGRYAIKLTTTNGICMNEAVKIVFVVVKQKPVLAPLKNSFCGDDPVLFKIDNLDRTHIIPDYILDHYQYEDGTIVLPQDYQNEYAITEFPFKGSSRVIDKSKGAVRVITRSSSFGCLDTTNFIPLKLTGASAGFEILNNDKCFNTSFFFRDTSEAQNTIISSREWNFGDGNTLSASGSGTVSHIYKEPGQYQVSLKITDNSGCSSSSGSSTNIVYVSGPKAAFSPSETNAHLNSTISFFNESNTFGANDTEFEWRFGDGAWSTEYSTSHTYSIPGSYEVVLIAKSKNTGCVDTARKTITIRNFNANFSISTSFLSTNECGTLLAQFRNTSENYSHISWEFGDGSTAENNDVPSHLYTRPGKYIVKLHVTGHNGLFNTYIDSVIIKDRVMKIEADKLRTCTSQPVKLTTDAAGPHSYLWDAGDGTIISINEAQYIHHYKKPGVYSPKLILTDDEGCVAAASMAEKVVADSLHVSLSGVPETICIPKKLSLKPRVNYFAGDGSEIPLTFHWNFGTGNANDTSNAALPDFLYSYQGEYIITMIVKSPDGCQQRATTSLAAMHGLSPRITAPHEVCEESLVTFQGETQLSGQPKWKWIFENGETSLQQNAPARRYDKPGKYNINLIVDHNGCSDTLVHPLTVHARPEVTFSNPTPVLCEGSTLSVTASGAETYAWTPATSLNTTTGATISARPENDITYSVTATDKNGCVKQEALAVKVAHPFQLLMPEAVNLCYGESVQLKVKGGHDFKWLVPAPGLSDLTVPDPIASPVENTTYTLVAKDEHDCFTDTGQVQVFVHDLPVIDAGLSGNILTGASFKLEATGNSDVVKWMWSPEKYLNCIDCQQPVSSPLENIIYTVTGFTQYGCTATDTVSVKLFCNEGRLFIPNAFTPNGDGLNDDFGVSGEGAGEIKRIRIYNRWGTLVFDRAHVNAANHNSRWNGTYKGENAPEGSYIYMIELSCNGKTYSKKGEVKLIR